MGVWEKGRKRTRLKYKATSLESKIGMAARLKLQEQVPKKISANSNLAIRTAKLNRSCTPLKVAVLSPETEKKSRNSKSGKTERT